MRATSGEIAKTTKYYSILNKTPNCEKFDILSIRTLIRVSHNNPFLRGHQRMNHFFQVEAGNHFKYFCIVQNIIIYRLTNEGPSIQNTMEVKLAKDVFSRSLSSLST